MPILSCYVDDRTHGYLKSASARLERSIEDLAEAAISEAAHQAEWAARPRAGDVRPTSKPPETLTRAQKHMLELAIRSETGNPWPLIGIRGTVGGAKKRMFSQMQGWGWFDRGNCLTEAGRAAAEVAGLALRPV